MASITFYTKPGCMTASKQIELLEQSGHTVVVCDLLAHSWTAEELIPFLTDLPVSGWFNEKSPRVKSGEINPEAYDREGALTVMLADHLLIHRPLMECGGVRKCGFDLAAIHTWLGLAGHSSQDDYNGCSQHATTAQVCP